MTYEILLPIWMVVAWSVVCAGIWPFCGWLVDRAERRRTQRHDAMLARERLQRPSLRVVSGETKFRGDATADATSAAWGAATAKVRCDVCDVRQVARPTCVACGSSLSPTPIRRPS